MGKGNSIQLSAQLLGRGAEREQKQRWRSPPERWWGISRHFWAAPGLGEAKMRPCLHPCKRWYFGHLAAASVKQLGRVMEGNVAFDLAGYH